MSASGKGAVTARKRGSDIVSEYHFALAEYLTLASGIAAANVFIHSTEAAGG